MNGVNANDISMRPILLVLTGMLVAGLLLATLPIKHPELVFLDPGTEYFERGYTPAIVRLVADGNPTSCLIQCEDGRQLVPKELPDTYHQDGLPIWVKWKPSEPTPLGKEIPCNISAIHKRELP